VAQSIDAIGKRHLWQIAIKPGRPMSFGQVGDCVVRRPRNGGGASSGALS
jgi:molybdopterin biosynthesis enzyme